MEMKMTMKSTLTSALAAGALALVSGTAAAQTGGDGGYFAADNCYYVPYNGQWVRKGCQLTEGNHTLFRNDLEGGVLYVWVQTANGPQWMRGDEYLRQLQAGVDQQRVPPGVTGPSQPSSPGGLPPLPPWISVMPG